MRSVFTSHIITRLHWLKNNNTLSRIQRVFEGIDSIKNYNVFKEMVNEFKRSSSIREFKCFNKESLYYGHLDALISNTQGAGHVNPAVAPMIEHGINFSEDDLSPASLLSMPAFVFQGTYKKNRVCEQSGGKDVFCIGPYIRYASPYYENISRCCTKRLVTVFPTHAYESSKSDYNRERFVDYILDSYLKRTNM